MQSVINYLIVKSLVYKGKMDEAHEFARKNELKFSYEDTQKAIEILENHDVLISIYKSSLLSIAKDDNLKCACGNPPYDNGYDCPGCTAKMTLYRMENLENESK